VQFKVKRQTILYVALNLLNENINTANWK